MAHILVVEASRGVRNTLKEKFEYEGFEVSAFDSADEKLLENRGAEKVIILCSQAIAEEGFADKVFKLMDSCCGVSMIIISAERDVSKAIDYIRRGAVDFLPKPMDINRLFSVVRSISEGANRERKEVVVQAVNRKNLAGSSFDEIIGSSPKISSVKSLIDKVAPSEARVLITGENGTGKELVARWLHSKSMRCGGPFIEVNCAAIPSDLIESELFGHEKGAFTSAIKQRKGKFELSEGGTLFLDEIGDMSLSAQAKVLRVLQEHKVSRVGSDKDIDVNVRVFAATNKNLKEEIALKNFREDLYHRLSVILINVPSLRDRREDIPELVYFFIEKICREYNIETKDIEIEAIEELQNMDWSGNIRQLRNVVERLIILSSEKITAEDVQMYALSAV